MNESLGLESGTVRVVPHDPRWLDLFAEEAKRIRDAFAAQNFVLAIEHMGSTAVPGYPQSRSSTSSRVGSASRRSHS